MNVPILNAEKRWGCPTCGQATVTHEPRPHTPMHRCPAFGLDVPLVEFHGDNLAGVRHVVHEREDYIGAENVQTDMDGRPVMAIETEHADGTTDRAVYAPLATNRSS